MWAILLEGNAAFALSTHKYYGLSPEAAKAQLGRWGDVRQAWHSSLWHLSNEGQLHYLEVPWMGEHYPLIETKIQKMRPTNQLGSEIITTSFNLHLQKLSVNLISGLCPCQHTYDTHFCQAPWCFVFHFHCDETWQVVQFVVFSRGHRKETDCHAEFTDFSSCMGWCHTSKGSEDEAALF